MRSFRGTNGEGLPLANSDLLNLRFKDLGLNLSHSPMLKWINDVEKELSVHGLHFKPHYWIADEWFVADGIAGVAIPFYLFHPALTRLHKSQGYEVEGCTEIQFKKLLRHKLGHAIDNAFGLRRSKKRQRLFGLTSTHYPTSYHPKLHSRHYVRHLNSGYAQAHPDEDWAETFAVWLNPRSNWKERYKNWPALKKLQLVDELMHSLRGLKVKRRDQNTVGDVSHSNKRLKEFYQLQKSQKSINQCGYLKKLVPQVFVSTTSRDENVQTLKFLKSHRRSLCQSVARRTGYHQYQIDFILKDLITTCQSQNLRLPYPQKQSKILVVGALSKWVPRVIERGHPSVPM